MVARIGVDILANALRTLPAARRSVCRWLVLGILGDLELGDLVEESCLLSGRWSWDVGCEDIGQWLSWS